MGEWGVVNIDHVVIGPTGAAVIETKMRAKPANVRAGEIKVGEDVLRVFNDH